MSKALVSILLAFFSASSFGSCVIKEAYFSYESGSEYLYTLFLNPGGSLSFHHERWKPSGANEAELIEYSGSWSCRKNNIYLQMNGDDYEAVYEKVGQNPVRIESEAMSLKVATGNKLLSGLVLLEFSI